MTKPDKKARDLAKGPERLNIPYKIGIFTGKKRVRSMRLDGVVAARQNGQVSTYGLDLVDCSVAHEVEVAFTVPGFESRPPRAHIVADVEEYEPASLRGFP